MKALVKKELAEAIVPAVCLFVPLSVVWFAAMRTRDVMWEPQEEPAITVLCTAGFAGLIFGYCQFAAERWRKTLGYVLHRGTSDGHMFVAKIVAGLFATALLGMGPPAVFGIVHKLTADDRAILQLPRIVELCWIATVGVSAYGLGVLVAQLHRAWWKEALFAIVGGTALALLAFRASMMTPDAPELPVARYTAVQLAIGAVLLVVAFRLFLSRGDRDLPLPSPSHAFLAVLGIVLFILPFDFAAASLAHDWITKLQWGYPMLLRERATSRVLVAAYDDRGQLVEIDAAGRPVSNAEPIEGPRHPGQSSPYESVYRPSWIDAPVAPGFYRLTMLNGRWQHVGFVEGTPVSTVAAANGQFIINGYFDPHRGVFRAIFDEFRRGRDPVRRPDLVLPSALPLEVVIEKPRGNGKFSGETVVIQPLRLREGPQRSSVERAPEYKPPCAVDLQDRSLWLIDPLDLREPAREIALPDGDRFVRLESAYTPGEARPGFLTARYEVVRDSVVTYAYSGELVIAGERGLYSWDGREFTSFERDTSSIDWSEVEVAADFSGVGGPAAYVDPDPISPSAEIKSADGTEVLFRFDYGPRTLGEHATVAMLHAATLVRSPLASAISFFTGAPIRKSGELAGGWSKVPLFYNQHRVWLLVVVLALAFFYTRIVIQTLSRRGAGPWTIGVWGTVTAIFGVYAYLLFRIFEPRGVPARVVAPAQSPAPLLIESGAHAAGSI